MGKQSRNFLCQLADRSSFYLSREDGMKVMAAHSKGDSVFVRGRYISNHFISQIRPCTFEENEEAEIQIENEKIGIAFKEGRLKIEERRNGDAPEFQLVGDKKTINEFYPEERTAICPPNSQ